MLLCSKKEIWKQKFFSKAQCVSRERFLGKSGFAGFPKNKLVSLYIECSGNLHDEKFFKHPLSRVLEKARERFKTTLKPSKTCKISAKEWHGCLKKFTHNWPNFNLLVK